MAKLQRIFFLGIFYLLFCNYFIAQNIDSLKAVLKTAKNDTIKIKTLSALTESASDEEWPVFNGQMIDLAKEKLKAETEGQALHTFYSKFLADGINNLGIISQDNGDVAKALHYFTESLEIKEKINDKTGTAAVLNNIGLIYNYKGDISKSLDYFKKSLTIYEVLNDKKNTSYGLNNLGSIYEKQGYIPLALEYFHRSLKIQEELGDKKGVATSLTNIASIYDSQNNTSTSLPYYLKALKMYEAINNKLGVSVVYNNLGVLNRTIGQYEKALEFFLKSLKIKEEINDKKGIAVLSNNIGSIYFNLDNMPKSLEFFEKSLKFNQEINFKEGTSLSLKNLGSYYTKKRELSKALEYGLKSYALAKEIGSPNAVKNSAGLLQTVYQLQNKYKESLEMYQLFILMKDSVNNEETKKASLKRQFQYEYDKKVAADSVKAIEGKKLVQIKFAVQDAQIKQARTQRIALYGGLILVILFAGFMFNRFKVTQKQKNIIELQKTEVEDQKHLVEEKQKEILDSITYAKRLQEAILPANNFWKEHLSNSFILYKPKDIVAGDFYWMETIILKSSEVSQQSTEASGQPDSDLVLFAAADCTGHGVPGALVSVVCSNALNRTVLEFGIKDPGKILDKTRELVIATFEKSDKNVKDGMDISLCCLNKKTNELLWAGANNPLLIISADATIKEIKADKQPIGKYMDEKPFTTHKILLNKNDTIYLFTDGFCDQFGGEKGKKFKYKQLKSLILQNINESMQNQHQKLDATFEHWRSGLEQVDDVCVIGIKI